MAEAAPTADPTPLRPPSGRPQTPQQQRRLSLKPLRPLRRLIPFVLAYPRHFTATIVFLLVSSISGLALPFIAGRVVDIGFIERNLDAVLGYVWVVLAAALVMSVAAGARFYFISILGERVLTDLRRAVYDHLLTLDAVFFDTHRVGELASRLSGDVATVRGAIGSSLSVAMRGIVNILGALILMFLTSVSLTLTGIIFVPAIIIPIVLVARRLRGMSRRTQDALAELTATATETLGATKTVKSFVQEGEQSRIFGERSEESYRAEANRLVARSALAGGIMFASVAVLTGTLSFGAVSVANGQVTVGQLAQFLLYGMMATASFISLSEVMGSLNTVAGATERLVELLETPVSIKAPANPVPLPLPPRGTIAFENVDFSYATRENDVVLDDLTFSVGRGETVALVGASGAGKSTVFALAQRFYDPIKGTIRVDGIDIRTVDPHELRRRFAYVEQEPTIFAGTIADNIRFGKPSASMAEIEAAAKAALVHDFAIEMPKGYDTVVGERGVMLSGGQKQRVAVARALLKDAPILLLDEATSALDAQSERLVQVALERLMEGRTTLVIAHRLATIRDADRIIVLERGRLIDQGTHDELVRKGGRYAELAKLQFRLEELPAAE